MGRIIALPLPLLLLLLGSSTALAQATPTTAAPPAAPPPLARPKCQSNLYLEPTLLVGATRRESVARLHGGVGVRYSHCLANEEEGYRLHLGIFVQGGSEVIGDAFTKGFETELNVPYSARGRIGGRLYYGTANHGLFIVGGGVRYRTGPVHVGFEVIYSSRSSEGQPAAIGGLAAFGVGGKPGAVVTGVFLLLGVVALASFNTT